MVILYVCDKYPEGKSQDALKVYNQVSQEVKDGLFLLSAADFHFEKEKEPGSFSFLPTSRSACVHASIPIPGLPFS